MANKPTIILADCGGNQDSYEVVPGIKLEIWNDIGRVPVTDGCIGNVGKTRNLMLRLVQDGNLGDEVLKASVIQLDGDNWQNVSEFAKESGGRDMEHWECVVPILWNGRPGEEGSEARTDANSNSLKLFVFERGGYLSEHTVSIVAQDKVLSLVHQVNRDQHQCFQHQGQVVLADNLSSGKQPKRTQIADLIAEVFQTDETVEIYAPGRYHKPPPDRSGLSGKQARCYMWTARRGIGGCVLPDGEQVGVYWKTVLRDGFRFLEPGQLGQGGEVVEFDDIVPVKNPKPGGFRRELKGVRVLESQPVIA